MQVPKDKENIQCDMILFSIHSDPENKGGGWGLGGVGVVATVDVPSPTQ